MSQFKSYRSVEKAPKNAQESLQKTVDKYGQVLNIFGDMAESPLPIDVYSMAQDHVMKNATMGKEFANLTQLAVSIENECEFCVAAHSWAAENDFNTDKDIVQAIRNGEDSRDPKVNALVNFARALVRKRGQIDAQDVKAFTDGGFNKEHVFEVLTIAAYKTITNYTSNMAGTQPNEFLKDYVWSKDEQKKAA